MVIHFDSSAVTEAGGPTRVDLGLADPGFPAYGHFRPTSLLSARALNAIELNIDDPPPLSYPMACRMRAPLLTARRISRSGAASRVDTGACLVTSARSSCPPMGRVPLLVPQIVSLSEPCYLGMPLTRLTIRRIWCLELFPTATQPPVIAMTPGSSAITILGSG